MTLFNWLLLGHLLGDWMFQNDWMAKGKRQSFFNAPILIHCTLYTLITLLTLLLATRHSLTPPPWLLFTLTVFTTHWFVDASDVVDRWMRLLHQSKLPAVRLMVDQTLHILVLAVLAELISDLRF
jgi:prepilin signal peptidase PulO-like enzyme (type II secretory pathway)